MEITNDNFNATIYTRNPRSLLVLVWKRARVFETWTDNRDNFPAGEASYKLSGEPRGFAAEEARVVN